MTKNVLQALQAANDAVEAAIVQVRRTHDSARDAMTRCEAILEELQNSKTELNEAASAIGFSITVDVVSAYPEEIQHGEWNITGTPLPQRVPAEIRS